MQSCIAEDGTDMFGTDNTKLLYNGAYILSTLPSRRTLYHDEEPHHYWDKDNVFIDAIEETYNKEMDTIAPEMFKRNETDLAYLSADILMAGCGRHQEYGQPELGGFQLPLFYAFNFEPKFDGSFRAGRLDAGRQ